MQTSYRESESAAQSLAEGRDREALEAANRAIAKSPNNPWAHYARAGALGQLGRFDEAATAFRDAETRFGKHDEWAKSISIYGRARALNDGGRCEEAKVAYSEFASLVRPSDPVGAEMALVYADACRPRQTPPPIGDLAMTKMVTAVVDGRGADALSLAGAVGAPARESGWFDYNRAVALAGLGRTEEALNEYRTAERAFERSDPFARALAVYGRARALDNAGRCSEAARAYKEYAELVGRTQPRDAEMARTFASTCKGR
jgi:tetratricopeptide (TPR) repeat protein